MCSQGGWPGQGRREGCGDALSQSKGFTFTQSVTVAHGQCILIQMLVTKMAFLKFYTTN